MVALYCEKPVVRRRLEEALAGVDYKATDRRATFRELLLGGVGVGVVALERHTSADVRWLCALADACGPAGPSYVVAVPLSLEWLQWTRTLVGNRFHVVWTEEAPERLMGVVRQVNPWQQDPLRLLGQRLLASDTLPGLLRPVVQRACRTGDDELSLRPVRNVAELAEEADVNPRALRRHWTTESMVDCSLKDFLSWAILLWALRERARANWDTVARTLGLRRRTLERYSNRFLGCTLAAASREPQTVMRRFREWAADVVKPEAFETMAPETAVFVPANSEAPGLTPDGTAVPMVSWPAPPAFRPLQNPRREVLDFSQQRPRRLHHWRALPMA